MGAMHGLASKVKGETSLPDVSYPVQMRMIADDHGRLRLEYDEKIPSPQGDGYGAKGSLQIFDGRVSKFFQPYSPSVTYPTVTINDGQADSIVRNVRFIPVGIVYRPIGTTNGFFDRTKLELTSKPAMADGNACLVMKYQDDTVWVDPAKNFIPTRYSCTSRGVTTMSIDIKYSHDPKHGWVPTSWNYAKLSPKGETLTSISCKAVRYKLNEDIPNDTFEIQYPPGTWVQDWTKNDTYIIREGKGPRPVLAGEFDGSNYEQLLGSEPPSRGWVTVLVIANVGILIAIIVVAVYYRRLRKAKISKGIVGR
jgi:hypothetical protein